MGVTPGDSSRFFIGLMSGTSLDGVDAVLADFSSPQPLVLSHAHRAFDNDLRGQLLSLCTGGIDEIERAGKAAQSLARLYAGCIAEVLRQAGLSPAEVRAIGAHGQTIRHRPEAGYTVQLNAPALLAELTGIAVVADFRSRDIAAGGQGAPLVPAFHAAIFATDVPRVVVNIGGISNVTFLPGNTQPVLGFDCGPGNVFLDAWAAEHGHGPFDRNGAFAAGGRVDDALLARLLAEPFLNETPPKSTGRELFSAAWLAGVLAGSALAPQDVQRTLTEFTARGIGSAIARWCAPARDVVVCGGGARNASLMAALATAVGPRPVLPSSALGVEPEWVEALAFAWLARRCLLEEPGSLPAVTGARGPRVLGAVYPR